MLGVNLILVLHAQACENIGNYIFECILNIIKFDKRRRGIDDFNDGIDKFTIVAVSRYRNIFLLVILIS
jgi:hypothetical protein